MGSSVVQRLNLRLCNLPDHPLVTVFNGYKARGIKNSLADQPWKHRSMELGQALTCRFNFDAFATTYRLIHQGMNVVQIPRLRLGAVQMLADEGFTWLHDCWMLDVDNPPKTTLEGKRCKTTWAENPGRWEAWQKFVASEPLLRGSYYYKTKHGLRVVIVFDRPYSFEEARLFVGYVYDHALKSGWPEAGFELDPACKDPTRFMRLPNVARRHDDGTVEHVTATVYPPVEKLVQTWDFDELRKGAKAVNSARGKAAAKRRWAAKRTPSGALDETRLGPLGRAVLKAGLVTYFDDEKLYLTACPTPEKHTTPTNPNDAILFIENDYLHCSHAHCCKTKQKDWRFFFYDDEVEGPVDPARCHPEVEEEGEVLVTTVEQAPSEIRNVIANPTTTLTMIQAPAGIGKTYAVEQYLADTGKTDVIVVSPTNRLAEQTAKNLRSRGAMVHRFYGVTGSPQRQTCPYDDQLDAVAAGGYRLRNVLCNNCQQVNNCPVFCTVPTGIRKRVAVGPRELLPHMLQHKPNAAIFIDEPFDPLVVNKFSLDDVQKAARMLTGSTFQQPAVAVFTPIVNAILKLNAGDEINLRAWWLSVVGKTWVDLKTELEDALVTHVNGKVIRMGGVPTVMSLSYLIKGTTGKKVVKDIALVSGFLKVLYDCAMVEFKLQRTTSGVLVLTEHLLCVALRGNRVQILGADVGVFREEYAKIQPGCKFTSVLIREQAHTTKGMIRTTALSKRRIAKDGVDWRVWLNKAFRKVDDILPIFQTAVIGTRKEEKAPVVVAVQELLKELAWKDLIVKVLHYGSERGLNDFQDFDVFITLGDPLTNIGDNEMARPWVDGSDRARRDAARQLLQVHNRARPYHRTKPAVQIHVGNVSPQGFEQAPVYFEQPPKVIREKNWREVVAELGITQAAGYFGVHRDTIYKWYKDAGETPPPLNMKKVLAAIPDAEFVHRVVQHGGINALAKELGCSRDTIRREKEKRKKVAVGLDKGLFPS